LPKKDVRVAVLVSGDGSNLQAILDAQKSERLPGIEVVLVLSSKADAYALIRARKSGIETAVMERKAFSSEEAAQAAVLEKLEQSRIDVVCLAGYMRKLGTGIVRRFRGRILNIHPALLPKFGGPGMYGSHVHEAVLAAHEKESGCSVHVVDEEYDHGPVLAQSKVPVLPNDTVETLAARVLKEEHLLYPKTLREFCETI
jgi:formyltetrahydrofolate-dependent phosphoribosylglycinamide formyltransferase